MEEIKDILNSAKNIEKIMEIGSKALKLSEKEEKYSLYTEKIKNITKKDSILDEKIKNAVVNEEVKEYSKNLKQLEILSAKQEYYKKREDILERIKLLSNGMKN